MLSLDFKIFKEITLVKSSFLMILCLQRMCLDLLVYILFCVLPIVDLLSQCMHIGGTGFSHLGISYRKWRSHSASSPHLSRAINSYSIVDLAITVCFEDFHETTAASPNVNT